MFKKVKPALHHRRDYIKQFPHCDQRILHAPDECDYCDKHPEWQALRQAWGIAFTGYEPEGGELPCPADHARGDSHRLWYGNIAKPSTNQVADAVSDNYVEASSSLPRTAIGSTIGAMLSNTRNAPKK